MTFDVGVIGLGAAGAMAAWRAAVAGANVLAVEQFEPGHRNGSSHGGTRVVRRITAEAEAYGDTIERSLQLFQELGRVSDRPLFVRTGGLTIGPAGGATLRSAELLADRMSIRVKFLNARALHNRFPSIRFSHEDSALFEPGAGYVAPELAIINAVEQASELGATVLTNCRVVQIVETDSAVDIILADGTRLRCRHVIVALGAWAAAASLIAGVPPSPNTVAKRTLSAWFSPVGDSSPFRVPSFPVFTWDYGGAHSAWGVTDPSGAGIKVGLSGYSTQALTTITEIEHNSSIAVTAQEREPIESFVRSHFHGLCYGALRSQPCMKIVLADGRFAVGFAPEAGRTVIITGLSGHGFKHAPALGEAAADLALGRSPTLDSSQLGLAGFS